MTSTEIITIITAAGVLLTALGAVIVNIIVALRKDIEKNTELTQKIVTKTDIIEQQGNSASARSDGKISNLEEQVARLIEQLAEKRETAALLAQSVAAQPAAPVANGVVIAPTVPHLQAIEKHTAETAINTKRTDDAVNDLKDAKDI